MKISDNEFVHHKKAIVSFEKNKLRLFNYRKMFNKIKMKDGDKIE